MKKDNNKDAENTNISEKLESVGINLTLIATLINFLELGVDDTYNISNRDIENLIIVMKRMMSVTIKDYDELECSFEV
ncbi:MAG: hypothetical protein LUH05_10115 [Candidatus Gastranaerophilales bacterium]|nr:hypothetical protein [Candidatus Gastranaerophilales bacterium]